MKNFLVITGGFLALAGLAVLGFYFASEPNASVNWVSGKSEGECSDLLASNDPASVLTYDVTIGLKSDTHVVAKQNEGFQLQAIFEITKATLHGKSELITDKRRLHDIRMNMLMILRTSLSISGVDVSPKDFVIINEDLKTMWSVHAKEPGKYLGVLKTARENLSPQPGQQQYYAFPSDLAIEIEVRRGILSYVQALWAGIAAVLGVIGVVLGYKWDALTKKKTGQDNSRQVTF